MKRLVAALAVLAMLAGIVAGGAMLGGCRRDGGGTTAGQPEIVELGVVFPADPEAPGSGVPTSATLNIPGSGEVIVSTIPFTLVVTFARGQAPDEEWLSTSSRVSGTEPTRTDFSGDRLSYVFGAGSAGETITITLSSVRYQPAGGGDEQNTLTISLRRGEPCTATLSVNENGQWREVRNGTLLGQPPLQMRLTFTRDMDPASLARALDDLGAAPTWEGAQTAYFTLDDPPIHISLTLEGARDLFGLPLATAAWEFYSTHPPRLCAYDPVDGTESVRCTVMPDLYAADLSADGRTLLAQSLVYVNRDGLRMAEGRAWTVDVRSGTQRELSPGWYHPEWAGAGRVLKLEPPVDGEFAYRLLDERGGVAGQGTIPAGLHNLTVSPDGTLIAGVELSDGEPGSPPGSLAPAHLVVVELRSGEQRRFENVIDVYAPANEEWVLRGGPAWSPDGSRIALIGVVDDGTSVIRVVNLNQSQVEETVALSDLRRGFAVPLTWSPDGRWWTAGELILSAEPGHHIRDLRLDAPGTPHWNAAGTWFALGYGGWGKVHFYRIDAIHGPVLERTVEDVVFPVGWDAGGDFHFVRWADWEERIVPDWD